MATSTPKATRRSADGHGGRRRSAAPSNGSGPAKAPAAGKPASQARKATTQVGKTASTARTATSQARKPAGKARKATAKAAPAPKPGKSVKRKAATKVGKSAAKPSSGPLFSPVARKIAKKVAAKALKSMTEHTLTSGALALRSAIDQTVDMSRRAAQAGANRRLPIQVAVDVAVPVDFAWEEWMRFECLCEGVDCVEDVERDGDILYGRIAGPRARDWQAEVLDDRPYESFAWRSVEGSDCAGLVTFHALSERLTRIEVDLDVVPTGPVQALAFASHFAHRRAETELRRFKAQLEFIDPDVYSDDGKR